MALSSRIARVSLAIILAVGFSDSLLPEGFARVNEGFGGGRGLNDAPADSGPADDTDRDGFEDSDSLDIPLAQSSARSRPVRLQWASHLVLVAKARLAGSRFEIGRAHFTSSSPAFGRALRHWLQSQVC